MSKIKLKYAKCSFSKMFFMETIKGYQEASRILCDCHAPLRLKREYIYNIMVHLITHYESICWVISK